MPGMERPNRTSVPQIRSVMRVKIISMGEPGCGKSCLIKRYCEQKFVSKYISTIGVDFGVKPVQEKGRTVKVNFWDLAGGPEYFDIRNEFYKDAQGAVLVFDVTSRKSFEALDGWIKEAATYGLKSPVVMLCANKVDAPKRAVSEREGKQYAASKNFGYFETTAKDGDNVNTMFEAMISKIVESVGGRR